MNKLEGVFEILSWDETPYSEGPGDNKQVEAVVKQKYSGSIEGSSEVRYLIAYLAPGKASFVGFETVEGLIDGKEGTILLQHSGKFENGVASGDFILMSGTGDCADMKGSGAFVSGEPRQASYQLELE